MTDRLRFIRLALLLLASPVIAAVDAPAQSLARPSASTLSPSLFGTWRIRSGIVAPWVTTDSPSWNRAAYLAHLVELRPTALVGPGPFACAAPRYEPTLMPPEALFQGNLPAPAATTARALGFASGLVRGISIRCASGIFEVHVVDATHLMVAVDNVIWTLDRSPGALAAGKTAEGVVQALATTPTPPWADVAWRTQASARQLVRDSTVSPAMLSADFDGDGRPDVAWQVRHRLTHERGILIVHASGRPAQLCGAGVPFGNGGRNFDWMDSWQVVPRDIGAGAALLVAKAESASGRIEFRAGRYQWRQQGD
ncbi:hypothetical protein [Gemmatimonas groenlandica]|uniref:VCBS repeat-containing protein n=1 Tax=Gemmatimonas groenlandica TaxID=2732249 RepID=A0A6M4IZ77_9BACT|nr:hypothetical protein [Gemmatimonas groenlandica]QJR37531.1 hypothetical protein HKW67_19435 [Gemmatimonas groenlandica]